MRNLLNFWNLRFEFESSVISYGYQTSTNALYTTKLFESSVISYGYQTGK